MPRLMSVRAIAGAQLVAFAAARAYQGFLPGQVDLPAEPLNVDVDDVRERIVVLVPHMLRDVGAAHDGTRVMRQVLEQRVLARGQRDRTVAPLDGTGCRVESEVTHLDDLRNRGTRAATNHGAQSRKQLAKRERLRQIVVGTAIESGDPV